MSFQADHEYTYTTHWYWSQIHVHHTLILV